jgi:hypothetical protein
VVGAGSHDPDLLCELVGGLSQRLVLEDSLKDMPVIRRDLKLLLPLLASAAAIAQDKKKLPSATFKFEELPVKISGGNRTRAVLNGATHKGSAVELHLTELGPGMAPHAAA